ncbi:MAG: rRNA (cytidine-2'-O-)-methyltransferase, partial [Clostridia bacterium]|nr:rRNA (cytidine-2'-O-)-methyltransferase [Clostridia bacterium]
MNNGKVYFVGTPIGNLADITIRAIETLNNVDYIACEDTRHSKILLNHYDIDKPTFSYHKFNEKTAGQKIINLIKQGKKVAII